MHRLVHNMRATAAVASGGAATDTWYRNWLLAVGDGRVSPNDALLPQAVPVPLQIVLPWDADKISLLQWTYGDMEEQARNLRLPGAGDAGEKRAPTRISATELSSRR